MGNKGKKRVTRGNKRKQWVKRRNKGNKGELG